GRDFEGSGDLLEDLRGRLPQAPLDLAQVGGRDPRHLGEPSQRHLTHIALLADELSQIAPALVDLVLHEPKGSATIVRNSKTVASAGSGFAQQVVDRRGA